MIGFSASFAFLGPVSAVAQTQQQANWCVGKDGATADQRISGCTAVLQAGKYAGKDLGTVFYNRAIGYRRKGDYDRAIQDYDQAITLDPQYAAAFNNRGVAYSDKGQYARAIQDYDQAIRLNPSYTQAIKNRAEAVAKKGQ